MIVININMLSPCMLYISRSIQVATLQVSDLIYRTNANAIIDIYTMHYTNTYRLFLYCYACIKGGDSYQKVRGLYKSVLGSSVNINALYTHIKFCVISRGLCPPTLNMEGLEPPLPPISPPLCIIITL